MTERMRSVVPDHPPPELSVALTWKPCPRATLKRWRSLTSAETDPVSLLPHAVAVVHGNGRPPLARLHEVVLGLDEARLQLQLLKTHGQMFKSVRSTYAPGFKIACNF